MLIIKFLFLYLLQLFISLLSNNYLILYEKKKLKIIVILILLLSFYFILTKESSRTIGINYQIFEYKIPLYLKTLDFFQRHYNYKNLANTINYNAETEVEIVLNTAKWILENIKKLPKNVEIIDHHPFTIIERRLGTKDQFNDIMSILLTYSGIESFYSSFNNKEHVLTLFKIKNYWYFIDPYYGVYFATNKGLLLSVDDIQKNEWQMFDLESKSIQFYDINKIFDNKFSNFYEVKKFYTNLIKNSTFTSSKKIDNTNIYYRGGRSNVQDPLGRFKYEIYQVLNK